MYHCKLVCTMCNSFDWFYSQCTNWVYFFKVQILGWVILLKFLKCHFLQKSQLTDQMTNLIAFLVSLWPWFHEPLEQNKQTTFLHVYRYFKNSFELLSAHVVSKFRFFKY
jgi:hypothetical protein